MVVWIGSTKEPNDGLWTLKLLNKSMVSKNPMGYLEMVEKKGAQMSHNKKKACGEDHMGQKR
jgi:hypothetical protein